MIDVIILSGGKGSRSENPSIPKSLQLLSPEVRVIDTICRAVSTLPVSQIVAVLGEHASVQKTAFSKIPWEAPIVYIESRGMGTSAAVLAGSLRASTGYCLIVMGDCAMSIALGGYLDEMLANDLDGLVLCRYSDHPDDSDTLIIGRDSLVKYLIPKEVDVPSGEPGPQLSLSGVLFIRTEVLRDLPGAGDFQAELFQMVRDRKLRVEAKLTRFFLRDTGTPKRLQAVQESVLSGSLDRRGSSQAAGVFIDRDGTLIPNRGDDRTRIHLDEVSPKVVDELLQLNISGIPWFVVSNQPGVAKGKITMEEVDNTFLQLQRILSQKRVFYDDFRYCPHHPERGWEGEIHELKVKCKCRKPSSGMIEDLAEVHSIDIRSSWIIGDSPADEQLAFSAGAGYIGIQTDDSDALAEAIRSAASEILNAG